MSKHCSDITKLLSFKSNYSHFKGKYIETYNKCVSDTTPIIIDGHVIHKYDNPNSIKKMSPMLSVVVTNELFHNGNVEAWKRIITSYTTKYPDLQIWVYYEGEKITDINALFKWGKVKHGSCIQFVVVGEEIKDVPKLKRYFTQGASPMFEAFLQGAPGAVLNLF